MASRTTGQKRSQLAKKQEKPYFYIGLPGQYQEFSDFVRVNSSPRGIVLSFGRWTPEQEKFAVFEEILLPFDTADALSTIIRTHIQELEKKGVIKRVDVAAGEQ